MTDFNQTADALTSRDTIETEITLDGDPFPIEIKDITQSELEALEDRADQGPDAEAEVIQEAVDKYLLKPEVDIAAVPMHKRSQLWFGMQLAWSGAEDVQAAMEEMEIPGNRT